MEIEQLKTVGQIAGIGGISIGMAFLIFREIIRKKIFPNLTKSHAFKIITLIIVCTWTIALAGIGAWVYTETYKPNGFSTEVASKSSTSPPLTSHINGLLDSNYSALYFVKDREKPVDKLDKLRVIIKFKNISTCTLRNVNITSYYQLMQNTENVDPYMLLNDSRIIRKGYAEKSFVRPGETIENDVTSDLFALVDKKVLADLLFPELFYAMNSHVTPPQPSEYTKKTEGQFIRRLRESAVPLAQMSGITDQEGKTIKMTGYSGFYSKFVVSYSCEFYKYRHLYQGGLFYPVSELDKMPDNVAFSVPELPGYVKHYMSFPFMVFDYMIKAPVSKVRDVSSGNEWEEYEFTETVVAERHVGEYNEEESILMKITPIKEDGDDMTDAGVSAEVFILKRMLPDY